MGKLVAPDKGVRSIGVTTERGTRDYKPDRSGLYTVDNPKHAAQMKAEGFFEASLMGATTNNENLGYNCSECGFGSWFAKCGRCGHDNSTIARDGE